ncbi:MAG: hypothetical protein KAS87_01455 [Candidatus Omnitrophica bacterium]|nr:hypothetical protein [Candidatus Omnitrophota bacterium]
MEEATIKRLETTAASFPARASFIIINSQATLDRANEFMKGVKTYIKAVADMMDPAIKKGKAAVAENISIKKRLQAPAKEAEGIVKPAITKYLADQDEIRSKAKEEIDQAIEKKFEKARDIERLGDKEKAAEIRKTETAMAETIPPKVKAAGTYLTKYWTWEEVDPDLIPRHLYVLDILEINRIVREQKDKTNIPGIRVFQKASSRTRL